MAILRGILPAMVTPMTDAGSIDFEGLKQYLDFLIEKGAAGVFPGGTAGEGVLLTTEERKALLEAVVQHVAGQIPVLSHTGALTTAEVVELSRHAEDHGAAAVSVVAPFYFSYGERELLDHYQTVLDSVARVPVYLYNIPSHAGQWIPLDVIRQLKDHPRLGGIKDSGGDAAYLEELCGMQTDSFTVLVGADRLGLLGLSHGARGMVSSFAGVIPELYVALFAAVQKQEAKIGQTLQARINRLCDIMQNGVPLNVYKNALALRKMPVGQARKPIGPVPAAAWKAMAETLAQEGYLSPEGWL